MLRPSHSSFCDYRNNDHHTYLRVWWKFARAFYTFFVRFRSNSVEDTYARIPWVVQSFVETCVVKTIFYLGTYINFCPYFPQ
jgi:hypothetical protein